MNSLENMDGMKNGLIAIALIKTLIRYQQELFEKGKGYFMRLLKKENVLLNYLGD